MWPYDQLVYTQTRIGLGERDEQSSLEFEKQTDHIIAARPLDQVIFIKKKENLLFCRLCPPVRP